MRIKRPSERELRKTWEAMIKFSDEKQLTEQEWIALSWLTLVDRNRLEFCPGNVRLAETNDERTSNLEFYLSLGWHTKH
jgi:hypothetical protein